MLNLYNSVLLAIIYDIYLPRSTLKWLNLPKLEKQQKNLQTRLCSKYFCQIISFLGIFLLGSWSDNAKLIGFNSSQQHERVPFGIIYCIAVTVVIELKLLNIAPLCRSGSVLQRFESSSNQQFQSNLNCSCNFEHASSAANMPLKISLQQKNQVLLLVAMSSVGRDKTVWCLE